MAFFITLMAPLRHSRVPRKVLRNSVGARFIAPVVPLLTLLHRKRHALWNAWPRYLLDTTLATVGAILVTECIATFRLYPRIPNISVIYLLIVLALATTRGRYAAIMTSCVAFLSFDFFIVPPLYTFVMYHIEEWISLFVFLITAILTGHLASTLRQQARKATRREYETHMLYDLVRITTHEEDQDRQLKAVVTAIVDVFSSWGVHDCTLVQQDSRGKIHIRASAYQPVEQVTLSTDEQALVTWAITHGRSIGLYANTVPALSTSTRFVQHVPVYSGVPGQRKQRSLSLIPLKMGQKVVGVLRLRILDSSPLLKEKEPLEMESAHPNARTTFFWTFLDQAATLIERARLQQENVHIQMLQRTDALRAALLSSVSHDLRTPLTVIKAAASSLAQQDVPWSAEERTSFAISIEREADRLNRLVGNLLDMSRIENGALHPEKELYHVPSLIYDVLDRLQPLLLGHTIQLQLPPDLPPIELDYLQIDQVLTNLIENAVRYTPAASSIEVSARQAGDEIILCIADRGIGIPLDDLERIFDKFYRVLSSQSHADTQTPTGSGLGLAVCKGLVEAHAGKIWAQQRPGGGTLFYVTLPVHPLEGGEL